MERKSSTTVVTAEQVTAGLKKANTTAREEQVLRLRHGLSVDKKAPLPQAHGGNEELADELLIIEMQLLRAQRSELLGQLAGSVVHDMNNVLTAIDGSASLLEMGTPTPEQHLQNIHRSVQRAGDRVRITAQLIDTASDAHLWAERYDRELKDIFAVQDDVARRIVAALRVKLAGGEAERGGHADTAITEAHDAMLRGLERFWVYTQASVAEARELFARAVELDPRYAFAHAWLSGVGLEERMLFASAAAGLKCQSYGARAGRVPGAPASLALAGEEGAR